MGNSINNIKFLGRKFFGIRNLSTAPTYDPDAQAYFNVNTAITSTADKNEINTFYLNVKSGGYYNKIKCMYLPIWLTANNCKWNLINNRTFDLTFSTGWTFSSSGMTPNGTSAFANTFFNANTYLSSNSVHLNFYSRNNIDEFKFDLGARTGLSVLGFVSRASGSMYSYANVNENTNRLITTNANSLGLHTMSRNGTTTVTNFKNGVSLGSGVRTELSLGTSNISIGAQNDGGLNNSYSTKQSSFISIGNGLSNTEVSNFYNNIQSLMTYFGINV